MPLTSQQPRDRGNPYLAQSQYRSSRKPRSRFGNGGARAIAVLFFVVAGLTAIGYLALRNAPSPAAPSPGGLAGGATGTMGSDDGAGPGGRAGGGVGGGGGGAQLASTSRVGPSESPVRPLGSPGNSGQPTPALVLDMSGGQGGGGRASAGASADGTRSRRLGDPPPAAPASSPAPSPAAQPAAAPTGSPSGQPAGQPSGQPAGQPSGGGGGGGIAEPLPPQATSAAQVLIAEAERQQRAGQLVQARATLNRALFDRSATAADRAQIRRWMAELNQTLVFSPTIASGDTLSESYTVQSGDSLERISRRLGLTPDWRFIQRINNMSNPNRISVGQKLKVIRGPFHAVVSKSAFRVDIYQGEVPSASSIGQSGLPDGMEPGWTYITSFPVGLGEKGSTPLGNFIVKQHSKLVNPAWVNPRTGEKFAADDPKNPIGERWVGIEGYDEASKAITGYGLHGTIEPDSIGREMSMGCVRLADGPVEIVYEMLAMKISVVKIVP